MEDMNRQPVFNVAEKPDSDGQEGQLTEKDQQLDQMGMSVALKVGIMLGELTRQYPDVDFDDIRKKLFEAVKGLMPEEDIEEVSQ